MGVYLFRRVYDWARSEVRKQTLEFFFSPSGSQDRTQVVETRRPTRLSYFQSACPSRLSTGHILHLLLVISYALLEDEVRSRLAHRELGTYYEALGTSILPARKSSVAHRKPEVPAYTGGGAWLSGERGSPLGWSARARCRRSGTWRRGRCGRCSGCSASWPRGLCQRAGKQRGGRAGQAVAWARRWAAVGGKARANSAPARTSRRPRDPASTPRLL